MYKLLALSLLAACELQPAPPKPAPAPAVVPAPAPTPPPPMPVAPPPEQGSGSGLGSGSGAAKPRIEITPACLEVANHVAEVVIASAEPAQRTVFEAERDRIVRSSGEVCTTQAWSVDANKCYLAAGTQAALKACEAKFPPPPQPPQTRQLVPTTGVASPPSQPGMRAEPGTPVTPNSAAPRAGAGSAAPRAGAGSAAPPRAVSGAPH